MTETKNTTPKEKEIKECGCTTPEAPKEVPIEQPKETAPVQPEAKTGIDASNIENYNALQLKLANLESELKGLKAVQATPTAEVPLESGTETFARFAEKKINDYNEHGRTSFNLPYETLRNFGVRQVKTPTGIRESFGRDYNTASGPLKIQETASGISISTSAAIGDVDSTIAWVPGGISFAPVRQFAKFKQLRKGYTYAEFLKSTLPASGTQTVGTTPSAATQTITGVKVTPSTITGTFQYVDINTNEDEPEDLIQAAIMGATQTVLDFEATDMLDTVSAEGTLSAGAWYKGDGTTAVNSDTASQTMKLAGIAKAREYLENQGYLRGGVRPVCALHPQQWRELATDSSISTFLQQGRPEITATGELMSIFGVDLLVSNAIEAKTNTTADAYNALMFVPQHSYGAASARDVTVKLHEYGEDNQLRVNVSWRFKSGVIDGSSIVRISTSQ